MACSILPRMSASPEARRGLLQQYIDKAAESGFFASPVAEGSFDTLVEYLDDPERAPHVFSLHKTVCINSEHTVLSPLRGIFKHLGLSMEQRYEQARAWVLGEQQASAEQSLSALRSLRAALRELPQSGHVPSPLVEHYNFLAQTLWNLEEAALQETETGRYIQALTSISYDLPGSRAYLGFGAPTCVYTVTLQDGLTGDEDMPLKYLYSNADVAGIITPALISQLTQALHQNTHEFTALQLLRPKPSPVPHRREYTTSLAHQKEFTAATSIDFARQVDIQMRALSLFDADDIVQLVWSLEAVSQDKSAVEALIHSYSGIGS